MLGATKIEDLAGELKNSTFFSVAPPSLILCANLAGAAAFSFSNFGGLDIQQQLALQHSVSSPAAVSRALATATSATSTSMHMRHTQLQRHTAAVSAPMQQQQRRLQFQQRRLRGNIVNISCSELSATALRAYAAAAASRALASVIALRAYAAAATSRASASATALPAYAAAT